MMVIGKDAISFAARFGGPDVFKVLLESIRSPSEQLTALGVNHKDVTPTDDRVCALDDAATVISSCTADPKSQTLEAWRAGSEDGKISFQRQAEVAKIILEKLSSAQENPKLLSSLDEYLVSALVKSAKFGHFSVAQVVFDHAQRHKINLRDDLRTILQWTCMKTTEMVDSNGNLAKLVSDESVERVRFSQASVLKLLLNYAQRIDLPSADETTEADILPKVPESTQSESFSSIYEFHTFPVAAVDDTLDQSLTSCVDTSSFPESTPRRPTSEKVKRARWWSRPTTGLRRSTVNPSLARPATQIMIRSNTNGLSVGQATITQVYKQHKGVRHHWVDFDVAKATHRNARKFKVTLADDSVAEVQPGDFDYTGLDGAIVKTPDSDTLTEAELSSTASDSDSTEKTATEFDEKFTADDSALRQWQEFAKSQEQYDQAGVIASRRLLLLMRSWYTRVSDVDTASSHHPDSADSSSSKGEAVSNCDELDEMTGRISKLISRGASVLERDGHGLCALDYAEMSLQDPKTGQYLAVKPTNEMQRLETQASCPVCLEEYSDTKQQTVTSCPSHHSFCAGCIEDLKAYNARIICPYCRKDFDVVSSVNEFFKSAIEQQVQDSGFGDGEIESVIIEGSTDFLTVSDNKIDWTKVTKIEPARWQKSISNFKK